MTDDAPVDCTNVSVTYIIWHDQHGHPKETASGCTGTITPQVHQGQQGLAARFAAQYTDTGGLRDTDEVHLPPNP